jgi:hypothetical protein
MTTIGDLLLLATTYKEPSHRYPHQVHANLSPEVRSLLSALVTKMNMYSEDRITTSSVTRLLILFAVDALELSSLVKEEDPLCVLPDKSTPLGNVRSLGHAADVVNLEAEKLTHIDQVAKGEVIWK